MQAEVNATSEPVDADNLSRSALPQGHVENEREWAAALTLKEGIHLRYDVILVLSPFAALDCPVVGPSVLLPQLRGRGISAKAYYANITLASAIGRTAYDRFTYAHDQEACGIDEALFYRWAASGDTNPDGAAKVLESLLATWET